MQQKAKRGYDRASRTMEQNIRNKIKITDRAGLNYPPRSPLLTCVVAAVVRGHVNQATAGCYAGYVTILRSKA
jgi:hypothetical protein